MFNRSLFNQNISQWDTSNVVYMYRMFANTEFNQNISNWHVEKVEDTGYMFAFCHFNQDLSCWNMSSLEDFEDMFDNCPAPEPYWAKIEDINERRVAIEMYQMRKSLEQSLEKKLKNGKINKV